MLYQFWRRLQRSEVLLSRSRSRASTPSRQDTSDLQQPGSFSSYCERENALSGIISPRNRPLPIRKVSFDHDWQREKDHIGTLSSFPILFASSINIKTFLLYSQKCHIYLAWLWSRQASWLLYWTTSLSTASGVEAWGRRVTLRLTNAETAVWPWLKGLRRNWRIHRKLERSVVLFWNAKDEDVSDAHNFKQLSEFVTQGHGFSIKRFIRWEKCVVRRALGRNYFTAALCSIDSRLSAVCCSHLWCESFTWWTYFTLILSCILISCKCNIHDAISIVSIPHVQFLTV